MLATPRALALAERATVAAVAGALDAGATTVGTGWSSPTWPPSLVGAELVIEAVLQRVAGRRLQFSVRLHDGHRPVANYHITRVVLDAAGFLRDAARGGQVSELRGVAERPVGAGADRVG